MLVIVSGKVVECEPSPVGVNFKTTIRQLGGEKSWVIFTRKFHKKDDNIWLRCELKMKRGDYRDYLSVVELP
jgi:hypothetical protein